MKYLLAIVVLGLLAAGCDVNYEARTNEMIQACKNKGGVPNIKIGVGVYDEYKGCDFPLPTK